MNHTYVASIDGTDKCGRCKFPSIAHGSEATCECCPNVGPVEIRYGIMLMCDSCWSKEQSLKTEMMKHENQQARVDALNKAMDASRALDASITVRSDLFNAETVSIVELRKIIDENPTVTNKLFTLAEELTTRFQQYKKVIFDSNQAILDATNRQKAIQVYLNTFSNQLRAEEREKLKIQDINYQPSKVKPVKPASIKTRKSGKLDKAELRKYAQELGVAEFTIQMLCVAQGITPEAAANKLRKSIKEAKSESDNLPAVDMDALGGE